MFVTYGDGTCGWRECDPVWLTACDPVIVTQPIARVVPSVVTVYSSPVVEAAPVETPLDRAWSMLASGNPDAMEKFGSLVAAGEFKGRAEMGYMICAALAGQPERAEWAAKWSIREDAEAIVKLPADESVRAGIRREASAGLSAYERGVPAGRADAVTRGLLLLVSGDSPGAWRALEGERESAPEARALLRVMESYEFARPREDRVIPR